MHGMEYGESFICIDHRMPVHGRFVLYYETPEYTAFPQTNPEDLATLAERRQLPEYDTSYLYEDDDDLF